MTQTTKETSTVSDSVSKMTNSNITMFDNLKKYLLEYKLHNPTSESIYFQRLKILTSMSKNTIKFKVLNADTGYVLIYTHKDIYGQYEPTSPIYINNVELYDLMPVRSVVVQIGENIFNVIDYTISRVSVVDNDTFLQKYNENTYVSYEGSVILCNSIQDIWCLRTNSCINAFESKYNSDISHGEQFELTCKLKKYGNTEAWQESLTALSLQIPNAYFVFVMITPQQKYLCEYNDLTHKSELFLICARDKQTHNILDIKQQKIFPIENNVSKEVVIKTLTEQHEFIGESLPIQGFIVCDTNGKLYRTYTKSYEKGMGEIPHYDNILWNILYYHSTNKLETYCKLNNCENNYKTLIYQCNSINYSICNILSFLFVTFTDLYVYDVSETNKNTTYEKTYEKNHVQLYELLKSNAPKELVGVINSYLALLSTLQSYSIKSDKYFINRENISNDILKFIRHHIANKLNIKNIINMIFGYVDFVKYLNKSIDNYNKLNIDHKKNKFTKPLKQFSNSLEDKFVNVLQLYNINTDTTQNI